MLARPATAGFVTKLDTSQSGAEPGPLLDLLQRAGNTDHPPLWRR